MMWNTNELTRRLGLTYPLIQAGMAGGPTTPELVAAVSNAGGLGTLGAGYMPAAQMSAVIEKIQALTQKPFGVNLFVPYPVNVDPEQIAASNRLLRSIREKLHLKDPAVGASQSDDSQFRQQIEVVIEKQIPVCSFTFGIPEKAVIDRLKHSHVTLIGTATTVREAVLCEQAGLDMVVAQGSEAGGHRGTFTVPFDRAMIGTMSLVPQTVDHVHIPVIAAGGIMDGRGAAAALVLGAQAVQMGTAFLTCDESGAHPLHQEALLQTTEEAAVLTSAFSGKPARGIDNALTRSLRKDEPELPAYPIQNSLTKDIRAAAARSGRPEWMSMWAGQGLRLSQKMAAGQLIRSIVTEIEQIDRR